MRYGGLEGEAVLSGLFLADQTHALIELEDVKDRR